MIAVQALYRRCTGAVQVFFLKLYGRANARQQYKSWTGRELCSDTLNSYRKPGGGGELLNRSYRNGAADDHDQRDVTGRSSLEVKMSDKQWHRQKSFSGDHSKNLKQSSEKSTDS